MIDELVELLRKKEVMIFAGAGISKPSGLPLAREFKVNLIEALCSDSENILKDFYERNKDELEKAIDNIIMERIMQILRDSIGEASLYALNIYKNGEYNYLHSSIAKLCNLGYVNVIFTTNFDCLLEDAMKEIDFKKCCSNNEFSIFKGVTLYKLHGSIDNEKTLIATLDQIGKGLSPQKTAILENYLDKNSCIFIGWSNDDLDITPILFHGKKKFFWVKHSEIDEIRVTDFKNLKIKIKEQKKIDNLIIAHKGYKIECNTINLLEDILLKLSDETIDKSNRPAKIDFSDIFRDLSQKLPDLIKFNIIGRLCRDIGRWEDSIAFYKLGLKLAKEEKNRLQMSFIHDDLGVAYQVKGEWNKSISHFEKSLELKNNFGESLELKNKRGYEDILISPFSNLGISYLNNGNLNKAADYLNKSAKIAKKSRNTYWIGRTLNNLGFLHDRKGETKKAIEYYEQSLKEKRKSGDIGGIADSLSNLAGKYVLQGNRSKSIDYYIESIDLKRKLGDLQGIAKISNKIALMLASKVNFERALEYCNEALEKFDKLGDTIGIGSIYNTMGQIYHEIGEWDKAFSYFSRSLEIAKKINHKLGVSINLNSMSIIMRLRGDLENSMKCAKESLALARQLNYLSGIAYALDNIGNIYQEIAFIKNFTKRGLIHRIPRELEMAIKWHQQALILHKKLGDLEGTLAALTNLGIAYKNTLWFEEALNCYTEGMKIAKKLKDTESLAIILHNVGTVYDMKSDIRPYNTEECARKAMDYYTQSLEIKKRLGNLADIATTTFNIGIIHYKRGEYIKSLKIFEKNFPIFENSGDKQSAMIACKYISRIYEHLNNPKLYQEYYRKYLKLRKQLKRILEV